VSGGDKSAQPAWTWGCSEQSDADAAARHQDEAWALQFEYVSWRRQVGLEPSRHRLNEWEQAMERIGESLDGNP
jgi:hypothetical protein